VADAIAGGLGRLDLSSGLESFCACAFTPINNMPENKASDKAFHLFNFYCTKVFEKNDVHVKKM